MAAVSTSHSPQPLLRVRGLSVTFGQVPALHDINVDVCAGEIVAIAGDNGAGKSTLLRCISGDLRQASGQISLDDSPTLGRGLRAHHHSMGVVWQDLALPGNLDVAATVMLGKERHRLLAPQTRTHAKARAVLADLGIPIDRTTRLVGSLTVAEQQLLAIARAVAPLPRLLLLDEPTAVLSTADSAHVEKLIRRFRDEGTTIVLVSHDVEQIFRLADRVIVLRQGRVVADLDPSQSHTDEVVALMAGIDTASAPRRQLTRLGGLADQLTAADRPGNLRLILSTLGAAVGSRQLILHLLDGAVLQRVASVGLPPALDQAWRAIPCDSGTTPLVRAVRDGGQAVDADVRTSGAGSDYSRLLSEAGIAGWWAVPISSGNQLIGVISVFRPTAGPPNQDQLALVNLYADYAATTLERERLVAELTERNTVLEAISEVLQILAGPDTLTEGVTVALRTLREVLSSAEIALYEFAGSGQVTCRAYAAAPGHVHVDRPAAHLAPAGAPDSAAVQVFDDGQCVIFPLSDSTRLVAEWTARRADRHERTMLEDAGHSILLALNREQAEKARREAETLRRSQEMQREFLARLSHELRTPLTAIRGYASSLLQPDVTWDDATRQRFLSRISSESTRLRRLVDDLLDFSLIESGILRVQPDWVDLPLVIDAARACLGPQAAAAVTVTCSKDVPAVWADHDRLEQVMMNLMDNADRKSVV